MTLRLQGKTFHGTTEAIPDNTELIAQGLMELVRQHPGADRAYGITFNADGQPNRVSTQKAAQRFTLVRIHLE